MQKLHPHQQVPITSETLSLILGTYNIHDFTHREISEGIENTSLAIETRNAQFVARIYSQKGKTNEDIEFEIRFQDFLRAHGIPIPLIHKNAAGGELTIVEIAGTPWQVVLMDLVDGESVTTELSPELVADLAAIQARMHLLGIEFAEKENRPKQTWVDLHDSLSQKVEIVSLSDEEAAFVQRAEKYNYPLDPSLPYGYNHLDVDFDGNIITKANKVAAVIDFDDLAYSPSIVCLGYSLWDYLDAGGIEGVRFYLNEYEKVRLLNAVERATIPHVIFFRNYVIGIIRLLLGRGSSVAHNLRLEKEIPTILKAL